MPTDCSSVSFGFFCAPFRKVRNYTRFGGSGLFQIKAGVRTAIPESDCVLGLNSNKSFEPLGLATGASFTI